MVLCNNDRWVIILVDSGFSDFGSMGYCFWNYGFMKLGVWVLGLRYNGFLFLFIWVLGFGLVGFCRMVLGLWAKVSGFWGFGLCFRLIGVPRGEAPLAGP